MAEIEKVVLVALTTTSAGTQNITQKLVEEVSDFRNDSILFLGSHIFGETLKSNKNIRIVKYAQFWLFRLFFEFFILPRFLRKYKATKVICLANFLLTIRLRRVQKIVLVRHPYLFENNLEFLPTLSQIKEFLRKIIFKLTLYDTDMLVCQTNHMKELYLKTNFKKVKVTIIPNPLSKSLTKKTNKIITNNNTFLYPSRYYKHKNHEFIINFVKDNFEFCEQNQIKFILTIAGDEMDGYNKSKFIDYIGEISQTDLNHLYDDVLGIVFPSNLETFGNGLIEGAYKNLPIVVPDLPYAKTILKEQGYYYFQNDFKSFQNQLSQIIKSRDQPKYQIKFLVGTEDWIDAIIKG